jgi:hypothetical protein
MPPKEHQSLDYLPITDHHRCEYRTIGDHEYRVTRINLSCDLAVRVEELAVVETYLGSMLDDILDEIISGK